MPSEFKPMRVEVDELDAEKLKARTGRATVAAAIRELAKEEKKGIYITYPRGGGTRTVTAGEMVIDLLEGKIKLPDGTIEVPSTSLKAHRFKWARSILFETDKGIVVRLEEKGGKWTIDAESWLPIVNQQFQKVYVTISEDTEIRFWASTHPEGVLRLIQKVLAETPTIYNVTLTDADTEYSQELPSDTKKYTVQCRTAFDVKLAFTEGESGTTYATIKANTNYYEDGILAESLTLYVQSAQAGVVVEVIAWT